MAKEKLKEYRVDAPGSANGYIVIAELVKHSCDRCNKYKISINRMNGYYDRDVGWEKHKVNEGLDIHETTYLSPHRIYEIEDDCADWNHCLLCSNCAREIDEKICKYFTEFVNNVNEEYFEAAFWGFLGLDQH